MSLANLSITINANAAPAVAGLRDVGSTARTAFATSNSAVDSFRDNMTRAADNVNAAAGRMGSGFEAANDAIASSAAKTEATIQQVADTANRADFKGFGEKAAAAFGAAFGISYSAAQTYTQKVEEYVKTKAQVIGIGLAIAAVSATAGVVYSAYKIISGSLGFIEGLFTGASYKAASIDELVALNGQIVALQANLHISAQEAAALLDATSRLGVSKDDYSAAYTNAEKAMRTNGDELDRLGVKYQDANGDLLQQGAFLANVKAALDEYSVGWERNAAATAMGAGSYDQITSALKVTNAELEASKSRLDDYGLSIGPGTQAAVDQYQQAMRNFNNETKLTSQGFSRAVADSILPALAGLATFFSDGFPFAVRVFRYSLATVTSMLYGLKTVADLVVDAIKGGFASLDNILDGAAEGLVKLLHGDFSGAADSFRKGWTDAVGSVRKSLDEMVADATKNRDRMVMAWGLDDRTDSLSEARAKVDKGGTKKFVPKPAADAPAAATPQVTSAYARYLDELDRARTKLAENEYASMRLKAAQLAEKEGITDLSSAYSKITDIQRGDSQKVVDEMTRKLSDESAAYAFQSSLFGLSALESDKLTFAMQKRLEVEQTIAATKRSGKPLDDQAVADLRAQTEATITLGQAQRDQRDASIGTKAFGQSEAFRAYFEEATNAATTAKTLTTRALGSLEDGLTGLLSGQKTNFKSLIDSMLAEVMRLTVVKPLLADIFGSTGSNGTGAQGLAGVVGSAMRALGLGGLMGGSQTTGAATASAAETARAAALAASTTAMTAQATATTASTTATTAQAGIIGTASTALAALTSAAYSAAAALASAGASGVAKTLGVSVGSMTFASAAASGLGTAGLEGLAEMFTGIPLAAGTNNVPYDGFAATLHKGEAVVPAAFNPALHGGTSNGSTGGVHHHWDFSGQSISVGAGVSLAQVQNAVTVGQHQTMEAILRSQTTLGAYSR